MADHAAAPRQAAQFYYGSGGCGFGECGILLAGYPVSHTDARAPCTSILTMGIELHDISLVTVVPAPERAADGGLYVGLAQTGLPDRPGRRARQSAAVRQLLAVALSATAGDKARGWTLGRRVSGQPVLAGRGAPAVSLAHSGPWLACAFGGAPALGIDIEVLRPRDWAAAAALVFAPAERDWVLAVRGMARLRRGYRLWTLKEAFAKAVGGGAGFAFPELELAPDGSVLTCPRAYGPPGRWRSRHWWRARQASVAVVWRAARGA